MSKKVTFKLASNPLTGQLEWAPPRERLSHSLVGWLVLAVSTLVFLLVAGYFVYAFVLSTPGFNLANLPGGGPSMMGQEVQHLRQADAHR